MNTLIQIHLITSNANMKRLCCRHKDSFREINHIYFTDAHTKFNPQQSSTYSAKGQTFYLPYGAGSLSGTFGYDTVNVSQDIENNQFNKTQVCEWLPCFPFTFSRLHRTESYWDRLSPGSRRTCVASQQKHPWVLSWSDLHHAGKCLYTKISAAVLCVLSIELVF